MCTNLENEKPGNTGSPPAAASTDKAPKGMKPTPPYPPTNPVDDPDELRPGSANDPRNLTRFDPLHISAGTEKY